MLIGLLGIIFIFLFRRINPLIPGPIIVVIISTFLVWLFKLNEYGVIIVKNVPSGLPAFKIPSTDFTTITKLLPLALTISFIGFIESIAVSMKIAREKNYEVDANKELMSLGLSNIFGSLFSSMPVTGGFSRTAVNNTAGANTGLASIITSILIALALLFLTPFFYYIPNVILASVIIISIIGLIDIKEIKRLWIVKKEDLVLLIITFLATLIFGSVEGILAGIVLSMLWFYVKTTRPHYAVLGRIPGSNDYRNIKNYSVELPNNLLIIRFDVQFYYGNVSFLKNILTKKLKKSSTEIKAIILEASSINQLDSSADKFLHEIIDEYKIKNIEFYFSGVKTPVMNVMKKSGFYNKVGHIKFLQHSPSSYSSRKCF